MMNTELLIEGEVGGRDGPSVRSCKTDSKGTPRTSQAVTLLRIHLEPKFGITKYPFATRATFKVPAVPVLHNYGGFVCE
jgi:hypothetical protein